MNPSNGSLEEFNTPEDARKYGMVPVRRDLTAKEVADKQIQLYSVCGCGSGKKFKFCCYTGGPK